jgi:hypothetical protein
LIMAVVVVILQLPYVAHRVSNRFTNSAMAAVTGSLGRVLSGSDPPELTKSITGYIAAFDYIQFAPWHVPFAGWVLLACGAIVAARYYRDPSLLAVTLLPQVAAIVGYALFLDDLDNYYYLSLMPAAVLTIALVATALPSPRLTRLVGMALLVGALLLVPAKVRLAATMHRMPEYGVLVHAAQTIKNRRQPMRAIQTDLPLPRTSNAEFLYRILGGRIDRQSPWIGVITSDGRIVYRNVGDL